MNTLSIKAQKREIQGKKVKILREKKSIPAAIFGKDFPTVNLTVDEKEFLKVYSEAGQSAVVNVDINGTGKESTIITEVQINSISRKPIHVSFHRINLKEEITANIPVIIIGEEESQAVKEGGIVVLTLQEIEVKCLPTDLPQHIELDISQVAIGDNITIKDIKLPKGVELAHQDDDENLVVASVSEPTKEEEIIASAETPLEPVEATSEKSDKNPEEVKEK